jgi:O-antigen/teichoic acid export membrane protein
LFLTGVGVQASAHVTRSAQESREGAQLTRRAALNTLAAGVDLVARLGVELVLNPLLVGRLGEHLFGVWRVLWRFTGSIAASSGRSAQALKWSIANRQASTDYDEKRELVGSAVAVWLVFVPVMALIGGGFAWWAPSFLDSPPELRWSVRWAAGTLAAHVLLSTLVDVPRAILQGENLGYKRLGLSTFLVFLGGALMALALYLGTGIVGVAAANLINALLTGALFVRIVRSHVPWAGIARPSRVAVRRFLQLSGWFIVWKLVMQALLAGDVLVLGVADSVESVTTYSLTAFAPMAVLPVIAMLVSGIAPGLGRVVGSEDWGAAARVRTELMALTWMVAISAGVTLLVWNRAFVELWVGAAHFAGTIPTLLIVASVTQFALIRNDAGIIDLTLSIRAKVLLGLLAATLSIGLAAFFVVRFEGGIAGLCIGIMLGRALLTFAYPLRVGRLFNLSWRGQVAGVRRPAAATLLLLALGLLGARSVSASSWPSLIAGVASTGAAIAAVSFFLGLSSAARGALQQRLRKAVQHVS